MNAPDRLTAAEHLDGLGRSTRRANGQIYTPEALADFIVGQALANLRQFEGPVLDPSCGAGVFLVSVVRWLAEKWTGSNGIISGHRRRRFLTEVENGIWGVDIDPVAVRLSREALRAEVLGLSPGPLASGYLDGNVRVADFLFDDVDAMVPDVPNLIVGNPPYVPVDRLGEEAKVRIRSAYPLAQGRLDLYTVFMERAALLLKPGGRLAFITPDKYLVSESARRLRNFLGEAGTIRSVTLFSSHRVFGAAATVPCVTVWDRVVDDQSVSVSHAKMATDQMPRVSQPPQQIASQSFRGARWEISRARNDDLRSRLMRGNMRLRDVASRISAGPATGFNPAFIVNAATAAELEPDLLHPTIRGRDIHRWRIEDHKQFVLVPYQPGGDGSLKLVDIEQYPATRRWLEKHKPNLLKRHCVRSWGKVWFDLHDPITVSLQRTEKIVFPDVARSNRFALDRGRFIPQHSAYYIIAQGVEPELLTAILNSTCTEYLVRCQAPVVKDGFSRYRKQFLLDLPIPTPDPAMRADIVAAAREERRDLLDKIVSELFEVDAAEVEEALSLLPISRN